MMQNTTTTDLHLRALRKALGGLLPADDTPPPPGPWDPVIKDVFNPGPQPDPWRLRPIPEPWSSLDSGVITPEWRNVVLQILARNRPILYDITFPHGPRAELQPLPLRQTLVAAFVERAVQRAELLADVDRTGPDERRAETYIHELTGFLCDPEARPPWPFPWPPPYAWTERFDGLDLVVAAAVASTMARRTHDPKLREVLDRAASSFVEVGTARLR